MNYFVEMKLTDSARPKSPQDGIAFVEGYVLPTLELLNKWQTEGRLLAGGPAAGAIQLALIIKADSAEELDELVESIPVWVLMETRVVPLTTLPGRARAVQQKLESFRTLAASMKS